MKDTLLHRLPPQNMESEQAVLSALLINNSGFDQIDGLTPEDFYKGSHQKIFRTMLELRKNKEPVDLLTVVQHLQKKEELESIGGASYLVCIADAAPVAVNIAAYAGHIMALSKAREMIQVASWITEAGFSASDIEQYISDSQTKVLNIQTSTTKDKIFKMDALMLDAVNRIEEAQNRDVDLGLKLGMPFLDNLVQISGSKLILIAARPKMGKTALALSIARKLAYQGVKVGFLSIEMDKEALSDRLLSIEADINSLLFYARNSLDAQAIRNITNAAENLSTLPIYVDDADCKIQDVERKCRKFKKMGCEVIFIDQLSKIRGKAGQSKFETYTDNCSTIAILKKELRLPIFLLCQLNRNVEQREDKRPTPADLKQTGMLEEDADMIFLIYRPGYYKESIDQSVTEIILAMNRSGGTGIETGVSFKAKRGMFELI